MGLNEITPVKHYP